MHLFYTCAYTATAMSDLAHLHARQSYLCCTMGDPSGQTETFSSGFSTRATVGIMLKDKLVDQMVVGGVSSSSWHNTLIAHVCDAVRFPKSQSDFWHARAAHFHISSLPTCAISCRTETKSLKLMALSAAPKRKSLLCSRGVTSQDRRWS